jgi:hypothetical protein
MASVVEIANSALNMLGANNINSLTEDSKPARVINQRYAPVRDAVFRAHPWNCLIKRQALAADTEAPAFEFATAFSLPGDCLRVLQTEYLDTIFRVEGRKILSDESDINILYISRVEDPNEYDTLLIDTIATKLAAEIAYPLVASNTLSTNLFVIYEKKLSEARFVDATEGMPGALDNVADRGSFQANTFIQSRF